MYSLLGFAHPAVLASYGSQLNSEPSVSATLYFPRPTGSNPLEVKLFSPEGEV